MVNDKDALLREVDEELRREQLAKLWDRYGMAVLTGAALIIIGVGAYQWLEARRIAFAQAAGARYETVTALAQQGKAEEAQRAFASIAKEGPHGYATLARLQIAAGALKAGKTPEAVAAYEALIDDSAVDPLLRDFARLQVAALKLGTADWTEMQNRLTPLTGADSPWRYSARELLGLAAFRAGQHEEARKVLVELVADPKVPPSIGERARILMGLITAAELAKAGQSEGGPVKAGAGGASGEGTTR
jgi:hypothetical protein